MTKISAEHGRGSAFLVELMAVILFLALSTTVILTLFIRADARSKEASELSRAVIALSDTAERLRCEDSPSVTFAALYGAAYPYGYDKVSTTLEAGLDERFAPGGDEYILRGDFAYGEDGVCDIVLTLLDGDGEIYSLSLASFSLGVQP